ncbi:MAG: cation:proton antiporter [Aggregatilineales bacterium]
MAQTSAAGLFFALGLILLTGHIAGTLTRRLKQPRVLGELLIGVILGPTLIDILHTSAVGGSSISITVTTTIGQLAQLGVLLLMLNVGLEVNLVEMVKVGRVAVLAGISGALLSVVGITLLMLISGYSWLIALFTAVALAATSVSISAQVLLELGLLRTRVGNALLAAALTDDITSILLVSLVIALTRPNSSFDPGSIVLVVLRMALFMSIALTIAWTLVPRLLNWLHSQPHLTGSFGVPVIALAAALLYGWSAEYFGGVAAITGAFIAGIGLSRTQSAVKHQIETTLSILAFAFLVPVFFLSIGLETNLRNIPLSALPLGLGLFLIAIGGKIIGCSLGAQWSGFQQTEALQLGICMIPRGEVSLIVASLGISVGVFRASDPLFSSLFLIILLTTVLTPLLVRRVFPSVVPSRANT